MCEHEEGQMTQERREEVATHEAGHVTAGHYVGEGVRAATIDPTDDYSGVVHYKPWKLKKADQLRGSLVSSAAGPVADDLSDLGVDAPYKDVRRLWDSRIARGETSGDIDNMREEAQELVGALGGVEARDWEINLAHRRAYVLLRREWATVKRVARALLAFDDIVQAARCLRDNPFEMLDAFLGDEDEHSGRSGDLNGTLLVFAR